MSLKSLLIHLADAFDNHVLHHRFNWVCERIILSDWLPEKCACRYCARFTR